MTTDFFRINQAYLYFGVQSEPFKGKVLHIEGSGSAWFVQDGKNHPYDRIRVSGTEGEIINDATGVWFRCEVSEETVRDAFRRRYEDCIDMAKEEIRYYRKRLKELGVETDEDEG